MGVVVGVGVGTAVSWTERRDSVWARPSPTIPSHIPMISERCMVCRLILTVRWELRLYMCSMVCNGVSTGDKHGAAVELATGALENRQPKPE